MKYGQTMAMAKAEKNNKSQTKFLKKPNLMCLYVGMSVGVFRYGFK